MNSQDDIAIIGAGGKTGRELCAYLSSRVRRLVLVDDQPIQFPKSSGVLAEIREEHPPTLTRAFGCQTWILSPGVPWGKPYLEEARRRGIELLPEMDFCSKHFVGPIVAITGSNGKSTCTSMLGSLLEKTLSRVFTGGNLGTPAVSALGERWDAIVLELSSFQLEHHREIRPHMAVVLNVSDNHLDRHRTFDRYWLAKKQMFRNMGPEDLAFVDLDAPFADELVTELKCRVIPYRTDKQHDVLTFLEEDGMRIEGEFVSLKNFRLLGRHNRANALVVGLMAYHGGVGLQAIEEGLSEFKALPHRLEDLGEHKGIRFINDSKSTTPRSTLEALSCVAGPKILILGGKAKSEDISELQSYLRLHQIPTLIYGEVVRTWPDKLSGVDLHTYGTLDEAFDQAVALAKSGYCILLSPACSSWDQFTSFEERGHRFKELFASFKGVHV